MDLTAVLQSDYMRWVVYLIMADWVLGVVTAVVKGNFKLNVVAHYLHDAVLPYVFVFAVVSLVGKANPDFYMIVPVSFVLIAATLVGNIVGNLGRLGLPVPKSLKK